ncbi:hypothetical protein [Citrobacter pasteurii]|uniref:DUF551 domain-containing protein n=1 Tax=Citrobacter pasteurii TaxID=1563222 RepID=A0A6N6K0K0_9ENTR|nr:hypothetical protein [Citrobacter pasteurii]KAA1276766.1 hypothetical protein DXF85_15535 [Citrobacter pasteurii]MDU5153734.1 hypothetical protein [Citrobacter sp.]
MKTIEPTPTAALDDLLSMAASAIEDLLEHTDPNTSYYSGVWADMPSKLRGAMLQAGNSPVTPDGWVMVPKEITCEMDDAAWDAYHETRSMSDIWAALLAAAPQQEVNRG